MAARRKSKSSSLGVIVLAIAVIILVFYLFKSGIFNATKTVAPVAASPTPTPKATQNFAPQTAIGTVSAGPAGWNHFAAVTGPKTGQVTLSWIRISPDSEKYSVAYGLVSGKYIYAALNIVDSTPKDLNYSYVIGGLRPGTRYYFALIPQKGGVPTKPIDEISIVAP